MKKKNLLFAALAAGILALAALAMVALWPTTAQEMNSQPANKQEIAGSIRSDDTTQPALHSQTPTLPDATLTPAARELAPLMSAPVALRDGGLRREFQLSTTELSVRTPGGASRILTIPAAASPQEFAAAIENARAESGAEPELVLYPAGFPQNEATRRIATREVVITAPSRAEADSVAAANGLAFKKAPVFAPNSFVYEAPSPAAALATAIQSDSGAIKATPLLARRIAKLNMPNDPYTPLQWHLKNTGQRSLISGGGNITATPGIDINVESVWNYPSTKPFSSTSSNNTGSFVRGNGVVIGIVDDGMEWNHPDLLSNANPDLQWDWNQGDSDPSPYYLSDAHGTSCAGVAAARGNNRLGVVGVAPEATLVGMRLISDPITDLDEAEAMAWLPDQIDIKSNSWGYPPFGEDPLTGEFTGWYPMVKNGELAEAALKYATDFGRNGKGTIITFAAGNSDEYLDSTGAILKSGARMDFADFQSSIYTIAVGSVGSLGVKSNYSQIGSALLISAPSNTTDGTGLGVMTTDNRGSYGYNPGVLPGDFPSSGDVTKTFGGTSSACPTVSGAIALMLQKNPDLGWRDVQEILVLSANKTFDPAGWTTNAAGIQFNYNYGAGLVDAAAAVNMADGWTNLGAQTIATVFSNATASIDATGGPNATITRTFTVPDALRAEHVTLALSIPGIFKGDLQINLTSPSGTNSVFCEPHSDQLNEFDEWTFMTVRNWGENSSGFWTLTITNSGATAGNLTLANLTVYGTPTTAPANPLPVVNLAASRVFPTDSGGNRTISVSRAFVDTTITLNATATDRNSDNTAGSIAKVEFFSNNGSGPVSIGNATASPFTCNFTATAAGNLTFTATATDAGDATSNSTAASATSAPITVRIDPRPFAAWDFDTATQSLENLAAAIQSPRKYDANFGSNNGTIARILLNGENGSSTWSTANGEIWTGTGSTENFLADSNPFGSNTALLLRGGKNLSANGKSIVFLLDMTQARRLEISYAAEASLDGFTTHTWEYWDDNAKVWRPIEDEFGNSSISVPSFFSEIVLDQVGGAGFNGRANARVRLTVTGATAITGTNLLDNIRFNATVAP
jgi:subtilisin family serine protease